jgi:hypothetical protein
MKRPFLFDELFEAFRQKRGDYVKFVPLYPVSHRLRRWHPLRLHGGTLRQTLAEIPQDRTRRLRRIFKAARAKKIFDVEGSRSSAINAFHTFWSMAKMRAPPTHMMLGTSARLTR